MKKITIPRPRSFSLAFFSVILSLAVVPAWAEQTDLAAQVKSGVNWQAFLARNDLVWDTLPRSWDSGAFIGNGLLGAMIYSEGTNVLQWDVGRSDVTDKGDRVAIGQFVLVPGSKVTGGDMRLDLWNAEARGTLQTDHGNIDWRSFTHAKDLVNVIEFTATAQGGDASAGTNSILPDVFFQHQSADPARLLYQNQPIPASDKNPEPQFGKTDEVNWCLQPFRAGGGYVVAWGQKDDSPGHRLFFFTVDYAATGAPTADRAVQEIQSHLKAGFDDLVSSHRAWWHNYLPESFLSIPDARMESFWWIQMYKLGSATRADRPAIDLMGPWFRRTPWPHIWWNLNIQLTYWPVYTANRLEIGESLVHLVDADRAHFINNVPAAWRSDSAGVGRSSPYDGSRSVGDAQHVSERGDLTWVLHNYWLQYRYSGDEDLLRNGLYPILKRAVGYYLHLLSPGADGKLHLPVSTSPEYPVNVPDANYDLSLLRWGLNTLLATDERLGLHDPMAGKWRDTLAQLTPFPVDPATGYMIGGGQPLAVSHRHFSHLFMVYPLHLVDPQSPEDRPLIEKSLDHWQSLKPALRGYSYTGAAAMCAWLGRNNDIVPYLDQFLEFRPGKATTRFPVRANTLYTESGPVIETPLACAASINEIVLQSWSMTPFGTHIRVFPAVPDAWKDVAFENMLAEGAFEVSAVRQDGKTKFVRITSLAGAPCRVSPGLEGTVAASGNREFKLSTETEDGQPVTVVDLKKGETVLLYSAGQNLSPDDLTIKPVAVTGIQNFYGSPKNQ